MKKGLTYKKSGVDIDKGERLIGRISSLARATARPEVIGGIGGFGSLFSAGFKGIPNPVLVSATDGVGTKLKVAFKTCRHDTVGVDLVAMSVNDLVTSGAEPLFFLDYLAIGKLDIDIAADVIRGIARGCRQAGCALVGGETAEMPGLYKAGEYDLAGFAVGVVDKSKIIDGSKVRVGDKLIGLASSGLHSNGFSLAREVMFKTLKHKITDKPRGLKKDVGSILLAPTRIYVKPVLDILKDFRVRGIAHITGGGFEGNVPRVMPKGVRAVIDKGSWKVPPIFTLLQEGGNIDEQEMYRVFNMGIGMVLIVSARDEAGVLDRLKKLRQRAWSIGEIEKSKGRAPTLELVSR